MFQFNSMEDVQQKFEVVNAKEFVFKGHLYTFVRRNENVQRGNFDNLCCVTFRNEDERHTIHIYFTNEDIIYVETGYGSF